MDINRSLSKDYKDLPFFGFGQKLAEGGFLVFLVFKGFLRGVLGNKCAGVGVKKYMEKAFLLIKAS
jgi:hypothetical protein